MFSAPRRALSRLRRQTTRNCGGSLQAGKHNGPPRSRFGWFPWLTQLGSAAQRDQDPVDPPCAVSAPAPEIKNARPSLHVIKTTSKRLGRSKGGTTLDLSPAHPARHA